MSDPTSEMESFWSDLLSDVSPASELDISDVPFYEPQKDLFAEQHRKAWDKSVEARCDFDRKVRITRRSGVFFISLWQKSVYGRTLTDIKGDDTMIGYFADNMARLITDVLGGSLAGSDWALVTTPKRRHKQHNFASLICEQMAKSLNIPFYEDVALCHSRQRVNAVFTLNVLPPEHNLIVFDDFVTTGQTLLAMKKLFVPLNKNLVFFAGINNKL